LALGASLLHTPNPGLDMTDLVATTPIPKSDTTAPLTNRDIAEAARLFWKQLGKWSVLLLCLTFLSVLLGQGNYGDPGFALVTLLCLAVFPAAVSLGARRSNPAAERRVVFWSALLLSTVAFGLNGFLFPWLASDQRAVQQLADGYSNLPVPLGDTYLARFELEQLIYNAYAEARQAEKALYRVPIVPTTNAEMLVEFHKRKDAAENLRSKATRYQWRLRQLHWRTQFVYLFALMPMMIAAFGLLAGRWSSIVPFGLPRQLVVWSFGLATIWTSTNSMRVETRWPNGYDVLPSASTTSNIFILPTVLLFILAITWYFAGRHFAVQTREVE
jgi:hypothetical protein